MAGPWNQELEATVAGHTAPTPRELAVSNRIQEEGGTIMNWRTLQRALATVVALAAISPLFASNPNGCARSGLQMTSAKQSPPSQSLEHAHR